MRHTTPETDRPADSDTAFWLGRTAYDDARGAESALLTPDELDEIAGRIREMTLTADAWAYHFGDGCPAPSGDDDDRTDYAPPDCHPDEAPELSDAGTFDPADLDAGPDVPEQEFRGAWGGHPAETA